ncbi:NmrA family protein [Calothrix sp. NIES-4071]|nr:NmrA family protein [Calothrix sp. NIES-4071]BAZ59730.1 NmrA family protein [Calothrix sp. NIES-4105]
MILVTTPTSKVGSALVQKLMEQNVSVRVGAHNVEKARKIFPYVEIVELNFNNAISVEKALQEVDGLYLAPPREDFPVEPIRQMVKLAGFAGVQRIALLSAMGIENMDTNIRRIEQSVEASGIDFTHLRINVLLQNYSTASAEAIRQQQGIFAEPLDGERTSFVDARDVAAVAAAALTEDGHARQVYTLTGAKAYSRAEVAEVISAVTGRTIRYQPMTEAEFRSLAANLGWTDEFIKMMLGFYETHIRSGHSAVVTNTVEQVLGRQPITLAQFAHDYRDVWL